MNQDLIDILAGQKIADQHNWIAGRSIAATTGATLNVTSPIDGKNLCIIAASGTEDIDVAVTAASLAQVAWAKTAPSVRKKMLLRFAEAIEKNAPELAVLGVRDNGTEISMAYKAEPLSAAASFRYYAETIDKTYGEIAPTAPDVLGLIHKEPLGVIGVIVPWNFPLMIGAWKIAPALAAGNAVVVKPPEVASLSLLALARLATESGLPDGLINVVTGTGQNAGAALGLHMNVAALAFTGSGQTGRRLLEYAAQSNLKRVYLELGGKSPNIVFADAPDLAQAAKISAAGIFRNAGQVCVAGSRLLVQSSIYDEFLEKLKAETAKLKVGNPLDLSTDVGAIVSETQLAQNLSFVERASAESGEISTGGKRILTETGGTYMQPTIVENVTPQMHIAKEEVFGPVLAVMKFDTAEEAVNIANNSQYGLASAVWTSNLSTAHRMVKSLKAGVVHVNTYGGADLTVPLGGVKQSGNGSDKSLHALDKYYDLKAAWIAL